MFYCGDLGMSVYLNLLVKSRSSPLWPGSKVPRETGVGDILALSQSFLLFM